MERMIKWNRTYRNRMIKRKRTNKNSMIKRTRTTRNRLIKWKEGNWANEKIVQKVTFNYFTCLLQDLLAWIKSSIIEVLLLFYDIYNSHDLIK